jgi:predicted enzyme related to lactoylglutathione lyase
MANPFVHVELMATDVEKAKKFYGSLLGWKLDERPMGESTYTMIDVGEGTGGGMMKNPVPGAPSSWLAYVLVDDLEKAVSKAQSLGASIMKNKTDIKGMGSFAILKDPVGAMIGLWQSAEK